MPIALTVHRLSPEKTIPVGLTNESLYFVGRTEQELSIVCAESLSVDSERQETGWRALRVKGPLDFGLIGILAGIASCLANASVSIFALSTFDTDVILVKQDKLISAVEALRGAGYTIDDS